MKLFSGFKLAAAFALIGLSGSLMAAEFYLDQSNDQAKGNRSVVLVGFSGSSDITDSQTDVSYDPAVVSVSVKAFGSAGCANPRPGLIRVVSPDLGGKSLGEKVAAYCQITVTSLVKGTSVPNGALKLANQFCSGTGGIEKTCSAVDTQTTK